MLKKNNFKSSKAHFYIFIIFASLVFYWFISSLNFRSIYDSEIEELQSFASSFSSPAQLFDEGDGRLFVHMTPSDILPTTSNLSKAIRDAFLEKKNANLKEIKIFIKFKNLEKILNDRNKAIARGINSNSKNVPCKISDGILIYKCKVKLKGDLGDHWRTIKRMSLRIKVDNGYIHGMKEFSIQKPLARQFPYDFIFHDYNTQLGKLSSNEQGFYDITFNGESWGVMNAESIIDDRFLEVNEVRRNGVFRISNQNLWSYNKEGHRYLDYFISDPTVTLSIRGNEEEILKNPAMQEIYSYIFHSLSKKNGELFDRKIMISNLVLAMSWGNLHALYNSNAWYTWNSFEQKIEPILTDQGKWGSLSDILETDNIDLPYEYRIIFKNQPLTHEEFLKELESLYDFFKANDPIKNTNSLKEKYFPNDQMFKITPIYSNISYLKQNSLEVIKKINKASEEASNSNLVEQNKITPKQLELIDKVVEIIHFTDGTIRVFNLLGDEIQIDSLFVNSFRKKINSTIPPSKKESLSFIDINTDFKGNYNNKIFIKLFVNGVETINQNSFSIININDDIKNEITGEDYCNFYQTKNVCSLNGKLIFDTNMVFNSFTVIEPGTEIILEQNSNLIFNSSVNMNGTEDNPITIAGNNSGSIFIKNSAAKVSSIKHTSFSNLATMNSFIRKYTGSVNCYGGTFNLKSVSINNSSAEDQLNIVNARINISKLKITNAPSDAFDCDFCIGTIKNLTVINANGDALDISGSDLEVYGMNAKNIKDKAFSVGEKSIASLENASYESVSTGIAVKDSSYVRVSNIYLNDVNYDLFMTYIKKPFFKGATRLEINNYSVLGNTDVNHCVREKGTYLKINNIDCDISQVDVEKLYQGRMKKL